MSSLKSSLIASIIDSSSSPSATDAAEKAMHPTLTVHKERHVRNGALIKDAIIGFADGLTVPFALCAGLSSLNDQNLVILGGLAELFAGAISMGLGAYLGASTERKRYIAEEERERREVKECPLAEEEEIFEIMSRYGVGREVTRGVVESLKMNEDMWVQFMMDFELQLEKPDLKMAWIEGLVMALSYFLGGLLPMLPYFIIHDNVMHALYYSIGITALVLLLFGYIKAAITGIKVRGAVFSAVQTLIIGAAAAGAAYAIVRLVNGVRNHGNKDIATSNFNGTTNASHTARSMLW